MNCLRMYFVFVFCLIDVNKSNIKAEAKLNNTKSDGYVHRMSIPPSPSSSFYKYTHFKHFFTFFSQEYE
jgi:hypothetical protein